MNAGDRNDHVLCMDVDLVPVLVFGQNPSVVNVTFTWDPDDPLVITTDVDNSYKVVTWELARDLIVAGLDCGAAGYGDVSVLPHLPDPRCVEVVLSSPTGRAALVLERGFLNMFLLAIERHEHPERFAGSDAGATP